LTTQNQLQDRWMEYAKKLYTDNKLYNEEVIKNPEMRSTNTDYDNGTQSSVTLEEVQAAVRKLKDRKSPGVDGIPAELIKAGGEGLTQAIQKLCEIIWKEEKWPQEWTKSVLVTIPKKGDLTECSNYRTTA